MQNLRKAFVASVMMVTMLSMSMLAMPLQVDAAVAGDLIKMDGLSSVYYLAGDGKRYVFPNETTYFSWYSDFSSVQTITQAELEALPLGANVTMRPGTKLVKITTNPNVYAVEPDGKLTLIPDEATAIAMWGDDWAMRVADVPDAFFTNYSMNGEVASPDYPEGTLVQFGTADVYLIDDAGLKRPFESEAAFEANRYKWDDIVMSTETAPADGTPVSGMEEALTDTSSGAGGTIGAGSGLTVALSGDTPASASLPSLSTLVSFLTVNLTASNDGDVTVQNLSFVRTGTGLTSDFDGGYVFVGDERLSNKRSVNSSNNTISFSALNLNIPAGTTKAVTLKMNSTTGANSNHAFKLAMASDVTTNGAVVSGSFPIEGNPMSYTATVDAATVTLTGAANSADRKVGETDVILGEFDIANDGQEIVNIHRIRLKQEGTAGNDSVGNMSLDIDGTIVVASVEMMDKYVDFMLETPFELKKSKTVSATIRGDVLTDISKNVRFYLKNVADVDVRGSAFGDNYSATISNAFTTGTGSLISIKGSEINVSFDGPQAADIKDDSTGVVLANFLVSSSNQDVNMDTLTVTLAQGGLSNGTGDNLENIEMVDSGNNVSYSVADPSASSTSHTLAFENVFVAMGTQYNFEIRGDTKDGATTGTTYQVSIDFTSGFTANFQDADETAVVPGDDLSQTSLTGKTMTIAAPSLTLSKVTTNNSTVVKDANGVLLYKGKLTATNVDDLKVSKLTFDGTIGTAGGNFSQDWTKFYLYAEEDGAETLLDTETSLGVTSVGFTGFTQTVPKGLSNGVIVLVRGDVKSNPIGTTTTIGFGTAANHTVKDSDNNALATGAKTTTVTKSHVVTVATQGTWTLAVDTEEVGLNADQNILAGGIRLLGRIKMTAAKEAAVIEDLVIQNNAIGAATNADVATLYLYEDKEMTTLLGTADVADGATPKALFQDVNIEVPVTGVTYVYVAGMIKSIDYSASPGADATATAVKPIKLIVPADSGAYATKALGSDTGEELTDPSFTGASATSTIMGAVVTNITTDFANGTLVDGVGKEIFSFKVTVPESINVDYDGTDLGVKLSSVVFNIASSGATISAFSVERVGGANGEQTASVTTLTSSAATIAFGTTYGTLTDLIIRPGDTAEYRIIATVAGASTGDSVQMTIESVDSNATYVHNTGTLGVDGSDTAGVAPRISGLSNVRGGTLSK